MAKLAKFQTCLSVCKNRIMTDSLVPWVGVAVGAGVGVHETRAEGERGWMDGWMVRRNVDDAGLRSNLHQITTATVATLHELNL